MKIRLLGPVEVRSRNAVDSGAPRQRAVLAALAVDAGRLVPTGTLIDRTWGEEPPRQAREALYPYVARLRRLITDAAGADGTEAALLRRSGGYLLDIDPDLVDALLVEKLAAGKGDDPVRDLRHAMELWRGEPLAGLGGAWVERTRSGWLRRRAETAVAWAEAELREGEPERVVSPLTELVGEHPLMEGLAAALMRALHAAGRGAEALTLFASTRELLAEELGADPGRDLTEAHREVLQGGVEAVVAAGGRVRLPPDVPDFVGRSRQTAQLEAMPGPLTVVTGQAGVGKTSLVVHAAHRLAERFPDGRVFLDLGGIGGRPVSGAEALAQVVRLLGLDDRDGAGAAELYRAHLANRRILVVLDNAVTESQIRPLLPWDGGSVVLVTSRTPLAGLTAERMWLPEFDERESLDLLARTAGPDRVTAEPEAALTIATMCGRLPLGIRIAGARLGVRRHWLLADLAERLADHQRRLDELAVGDLTVRASIALSHRALEPHEQEIFRLLGQLHGTTFPAWAPATLADAAEPDMAGTLERLVDWHLLEVVDRDHANRQRYRMHDLVSLYARELPGGAGAEDERRAARSAALDVWVTVFDRMEKRLVSGDPAGPRHPSRRKYPLGWVPALRSAMSGQVTDAVGTVLETGWSLTGIVVPLSFELWSQWDDWEATLASARHSSRRAGDRLVASRLDEDGVPESLTVEPGVSDPWAGMVANVERVVQSFRRLGDLDWHAMSLLTLGNVNRAHGQFASAARTLDRCVALFNEVGNPDWRVAALLSRASQHVIEGELTEAVRLYRGCLATFADRGDPLWQAYTRRALGYAFQQHGRFAEAVEQLEPAVPVLREHGDRVWEGHTLLSLGLAELGRGRRRKAAGHLDASLELFRAYGDRRSEALALRARARTRTGLESERTLREALAIFLALEDPGGAALVLRGLAALSSSRGQARAAERYRRLARSAKV
ncbi:AfsR/SARP family transcriptional regulator [Paractinoplanes lichenicola]|uniref:Winged helix-turn-helix domain-containing protein n=1 Tax=Paractinoplanes lichenicola TaxID=2802976 RepID=A0ABS1W5V3_9ACTN|nr:BTAD domain-containing putative transcriptional regulator [Actinoplanes lichenicola]MBL7262073.1 winged helix-turn-helix domain-containing protein [Actinoplanes lichenicola]